MKELMVRIVVDDRERNESVLNCLKIHSNVDVEICRLPLGDYLLPNLLVERKSFTDFCKSIKDGRFFKQAGKLANSRIQPLIILERDPQRSSLPHISVQALQGALITASILYSIPVIRSRSAEETVRLMLHSNDQIRRFGIKIKCWKRPKPFKQDMNQKMKMQLHILEGFPGIGPFLANQLINKLGSIRAIINATPHELRTLGGISQNLAERIVNLVN